MLGQGQGTEPMIPSNTVRDGDSDATAQRLLDIVNGSWMAQATYVAAYLRIPDLVAAGPKSTEELARAVGAHAPSLRRLLRALVTIDILREHDDGAYALTPMGSWLRADVDHSLHSWTLYWGGPQWPIWGNLLHSVMTGESARKLASGGGEFDRLETDAEAAALFNRAMVELTRLESRNIARAVDFAGGQRIVDVGGGYGALLAEILRAHPDARGVLYDRPHAIESARRLMEAAAVAARCEFVAGDFFASIPAGADVYLLKSVIHDWNDERSSRILANCASAMHAQARLLLVERIVPPRLDASAAHRALVRADLNMLVGLGGRERTEEEYRALLNGAELRLQAVWPAGKAFSVIEAIRSR